MRGMHPTQNIRRATPYSSSGRNTTVVVTEAESLPAPERNRVNLGSKLQGVLASALGCGVVVTHSACPVGLTSSSARSNCFWVECFSDKNEGELRQFAGGMRPHGRGPEQLLSLGLSGRESEVLFWVAQGKTNPEIAVILGIGRRTVATHVEHILAKLGVENRCAAARCASEALFG